MGIQSMGFTETDFAGEVTILKRPGFEGIPVTLDSTAFTSGVCKAGTPITASGTIDNTGSSVAIGILKDDVLSDRPQGTILTKAYLNASVVASHSGLTIDAAVKERLPMIIWD